MPKVLIKHILNIFELFIACKILRIFYEYISMLKFIVRTTFSLLEILLIKYRPLEVITHGE